MKMKLEPWQEGALVGLMIGITLSLTTIEFIVMLQIPAIIMIAFFVIIGAVIGNRKK